MEGAFPGHEREPGEPDAGSVQPRRTGAGFLPFLERVLDSEAKTRRLGFLVRQVGVVIVAVLISLAAVGYILMYKSSIWVKIAVLAGSIVLIILGRFWSISRWARRKNLEP